MTDLPRKSPTVSVVINTDGRRDALAATLDGLSRLKYRAFEICIVCGPTPDGTREYVASLGNAVKTTNCPERNLSQSRNLGIALAAGEIVAFIDDDGIPEAEWLDELVLPFAEPRTGAAGGLVYDHTGYSYQYLYAACDRLGNAITDLTEPARDWNYPLAARFPYVQGTNSAFRRADLSAIGGFDEEFEFYLDETDVCCRMIDAGLEIAQVANARVHHKFLPSHIRDSNRITVKKYAVIKNKIYFSLVNNRGHHSRTEIVQDALSFVNQNRDDLIHHVQGGRLSSDELSTFDQDVEKAWSTGLARGLSGMRRTQKPAFFANPPAFRRFQTIVPPGGARAILFLSQDYPPASQNGVSRYTHDIARAIAGLGHVVHVLTKGDDHNRVDLEDGVWVHRIVDKGQPTATLADGTAIPAHIWNHSATMLEEAQRIARSRPIDAVEGVSWDCETAAFVLDGSLPVATNIVTSLSDWLDTHPEQQQDAAWMTAFGTPMLALERHILRESDRLVAASDAIVQSMSRRYDVMLDPERVIRCPHASTDMLSLPRARPAALPAIREKAEIPVLFVGRLEKRKGIDLLLEAAPDLLAADPRIRLWIAGDDTIDIGGGTTARDAFLARGIDEDIAARVHFLGRVSDEELRWLYANCAIFTAPSRFESYGLMLVEAMMFSRPVVAAAAGGMVEIVADKKDGLLVAPDDAAALGRALLALAADPALRKKLGTAGRRKFEQRYAAPIVAQRRVAALADLARTPLALDEAMFAGDVSRVSIGADCQGWSLGDGATLTVRCATPLVYLTFFTHDWSGIVDITIDGAFHACMDLYSPNPGTRTKMLDADLVGREIVVSRSGRKSPAAESAEVIIIAASGR